MLCNYPGEVLSPFEGQGHEKQLSFVVFISKKHTEIVAGLHFNKNKTKSLLPR